MESSQLWLYLSLLTSHRRSQVDGCTSRAGRRTTNNSWCKIWHSQFLSLHIDFFAARLLHLIVPNVVSTLLEIVDILRIDLQHDDDNIEIHFFTGRVPVLAECLAASSLP